MAKRVLFACDLDSQIFGALPLADAFETAGWTVSFALHAPGALPPGVLSRITNRFEVHDAWIGPLAVSDLAFSADAIGVFATGSRIARFRYDNELAWRVRGGRRPALFCGFNGLVFERFEEGLAWRLGYDVLCLNGPRDEDAFRDFAGGTAFADQPIATVGLRRRRDVTAAAPRDAGSPKTFLFAEQVAAPSDPEHRERLAATLARLATASPDWRVVVRPRVQPGERTFHDQTLHMETLLKRLPARPSNLIISYEPLESLLDGADLFATISSTALFDALDHGVTCCVLLDFGVRNAYGSHVLFGSGLGVDLSRLATLDDAPRRAPDAGWLDRIGYGATHSPQALLARIAQTDITAPPPPQLQTGERALIGASARVSRTEDEALARDRATVEAALAAGDGPAARAALARLGATLTASDTRHDVDSAWRRREGAVAALARKAGFYWLYKRLRRITLGAAPR
ncbi:DUF6716 putative glycosyltransferase [Methylopila turkensis]|uniref:Uncharacterized protein n=1 Tax=Methylopila turkensis TaxID=1437816 RepID=A0A9W6N892_9HYPH|nr:DUF6716 putative glycosyltransferase [Methylopila turkensis]GLK81313.1 hypothetical protein GCM10008174_30540 [Methylopila turkensis]